MQEPGLTLSLEWQISDALDHVTGTLTLAPSHERGAPMSCAVELMPRHPQMIAHEGVYLHLSLVTSAHEVALHLSVTSSGRARIHRVLARWPRQA